MPVLSEIRLITFDLDDTLWPCMPTIHAAEQKLYNWLQENAPGLTDDHDIDSLRAHRIAVTRKNTALAHNLTEMRLRSLQALAAEYDLDKDLPYAANAVFRQARNIVTPYDEVIGALQSLARHYVLIAVSNGNAEVQHTPLANCFEHHFTAEQVGAAKPDPALFFAASDASGIALSSALHVGDDPLRDIEAARLAGMRTAWVDRHRQSWPVDYAKADIHVADLNALTHLLI